MWMYPSADKRTDNKQLQAEIDLLTKNPVIDGLMNVVSGLMAVLNENREMLAINEAMLDHLGIEDASAALGLRLGEAVNCIHVKDGETGCGTSAFCSTCGAAIAIVTSLETDQSAQQRCAIEMTKDGKPHDLYLEVRAYPIRFTGKRFLLLFMQDISALQKWQALSRVFIHDFNNVLMSLLGGAEMLMEQTTGENRDLARNMRDISLRLSREIEMQKHLVDMQGNGYEPLQLEVSIADVLRDLGMVFANHPAATRKTLVLPEDPPTHVFRSDPTVITRVMDNLIINALEAVRDGGEVKVSVEKERDEVRFGVWNAGAIPEDILRRIFQRNFSTKHQSGRGLGLFAAKLFTEESLGGTIDVTSSVAEGTRFTLTLPAT